MATVCVKGSSKKNSKTAYFYDIATYQIIKRYDTLRGNDEDVMRDIVQLNAVQYLLQMPTCCFQ